MEGEMMESNLRFAEEFLAYIKVKTILWSALVALKASKELGVSGERLVGKKAYIELLKLRGDLKKHAKSGLRIMKEFKPGWILYITLAKENEELDEFFDRFGRKLDEVADCLVGERKITNKTIAFLENTLYKLKDFEERILKPAWW
jgi:hypothetical protein